MGEQSEVRLTRATVRVVLLLLLLTQQACSAHAPPPVVEVAVWGSSSAQRLVEQGGLAQTLGVEVYDGGVGGELSPVIAARQGGSPAMLQVVGGVIPTSGTVAVRNESFPPPRPDFALGGTLAGVEGTLETSGQGYVFARRAPGPEVSSTAPTPMVSDASVAHAKDVTLLWMGKNDVSALQWRTAGEQTRAAWIHAQGRSGRVLVLGHFADADMAPGSRKRDAFDRLQREYVTDYGAAFVDVESYVRSPQVWADTSLTPTPADLDAQRLGTLPPSLGDGYGQHLSAGAYQAVGEHLLKPRLQGLGWVG